MHPLIRVVPLLVALALSAADARAATFVVTIPTDANDDGVCTPDACTLREAMNAAVATPGRDTITFDPAVLPLGQSKAIGVTDPLPVLADPAGTVVDGAGASVILAGSGAADGLVFASAAGTPLSGVRVANLTVVGFPGTGIVICGGEYPACAANVAKPVVENVNVAGNEVAGVRIRGADVTKVRLTNVVARLNGFGIAIAASGVLAGTQIDGCTARFNGMATGDAGISLTSPNAISGITIGNTIGVENGGPAVLLRSEGALSKVKLTKVVATKNVASGIVIGGVVSAAGVALLDVTSVANQFEGIAFFGGSLTGTSVKGLVSNRNGGDGLRISPNVALAGAKITDVRAIANEGDGVEIAAAAVSGVQITRTVVTGNEGIGLRLPGSGHKLKTVRADRNGAGIQLDAPGSGNVIEQCRAHANDGSPGGAGIRIAAGNTGNVIRDNAAQANDGPNLVDGNANCAGNAWSNNFAVTADACLD